MRRTVTALSILIVIATACAATTDSKAPSPASKVEGSSEAILEQIEFAFNEKDAETLASLVSEEFEYLAITDEGVSIESRGRDEFLASMTAYFQQYDSVTTRFEATLEAGPFVAIRETVTWRNGDRMQGQSSLAVYEIREGKIVRAWYFPAYRMMMAMP